jgi:hypothetical protein
MRTIIARIQSIDKVDALPSKASQSSLSMGCINFL